jgi:hypothetical protein
LALVYISDSDPGKLELENLVATRVKVKMHSKLSEIFQAIAKRYPPVQGKIDLKSEM